MKIKTARMSYTVLADFLTAKGQDITSSAPSDLRCVGVDRGDPGRFIIYVESDSFEDIGVGFPIPELDIVLTRNIVCTRNEWPEKAKEEKYHVQEDIENCASCKFFLHCWGKCDLGVVSHPTENGICGKYQKRKEPTNEND